MATKDIRPSTAYTTCDVCGRTLLRGERAQVYLDGGARRSVCELCTSRAIQEGWVREGALPAYDGRDAGSERRRSLLSRLRGRREQPAPAQEAPSLREELDRKSWVDAAKQAPVQVREPRHVRAIPTSVEHKVSSAIDAFNASEHTRTVAGVARSLGAPTVAVQPVDARPGLVNLVLSWELCWYRYEVDLSDDQPGVRLVGQGYELDELPAQERQANAVSDETGALALRE